jgi:hypothetical protein
MLRTKLPFFLAYARARQQPIFIDYIEIGVRGQYIDTGIVLSYNHKVTAVVKPVEDGSGANHIIFGNLVDQTKGFSCACANKVINSRFDGTLIADNLYRGGDTPHTYTVDKNGIVIDDEPIKTWNATPRNFTTIGTCLLSGNRGYNNQPVNYMGIGSRIYDFKVWENDILVQHLRPCLHPETFKACMYDTVTKQYFYNKATSIGSFIPAPRFVEYIESDGNQWIDTQHIISSENIKLNIKANISTLENMKTLCGSQIDGYNGFGGLIYYNSSYGGLGVCVGTNYNNDTYSPITAGVDYELEHTANNGVAALTKNGVVATTTYTGTLKSNKTWYLFWSNGGASVYKIKAKVYYARLEDNGVVVRDLRPCLRGNTPCMYDMVTGTYFYNQGTGEFIAGGEMVNFDYTRIHAWINPENIWRPAGDSCSFLIPLTVGKRYKIVWQNANAMIDGIPNGIFRYGQTNDSVPSGQLLNDCVRTTPQDTPVAEITAINKYLVVQIGSTLGDQMAKYELFKVYEI